MPIKTITLINRIIKSDKKITPFGGIFFVIDLLKRRGLDKLIDKVLGTRPKQCKYSYSDIITGWMCANFCGAERLEDIHHFNHLTQGVPFLNSPSSDTLSRTFRMLKEPSFTSASANNKTHTHNINGKMHRILLGAIKKLRLIPKSKDLTLDYDHSILYHEKWDCQKTYEGERGYQPGIAFIGQTPVYIEMRNGGTNAVYEMGKSMKRCLDMLKEQNIDIKRFRSDAAAYQIGVMKEMEERGIEFFIRAQNRRIDAEYQNGFYWVNAVRFGRERELISEEYEFHGNTYRLVICKHTSDSGKVKFRGVITNNWTWSEEQVFQFYNARGAIERHFDDLKNNFNWGRVPFSFMEENQVFLLIGALASVFYQYCVKTFSSRTGWFAKNIRLKRFRFLFIDVSAIWLEEGLEIFDARDYSLLD